MLHLMDEGTPVVQEDQNLADFLRSHLSYDKDTGSLTWLVDRRGRAKAGSDAGHLDGNGYIRVKAMGSNVRAHRICWFLYHGTFPTNVIDHINGVKSDNRIANLRDVSVQINNQNHTAPNKSKRSATVRGPTWQRARQRWMVKIRISGSEKFIGRYKELADAVAAYEAARDQYHYGFVRRT